MNNSSETTPCSAPSLDLQHLYEHENDLATSYRPSQEMLDRLWEGLRNGTMKLDPGIAADGRLMEVSIVPHSLSDCPVRAPMGVMVPFPTYRQIDPAEGNLSDTGESDGELQSNDSTGSEGGARGTGEV